MKDIKIQIRFTKDFVYVGTEKSEELRENYLTYKVDTRQEVLNDIFYFILLRMKGVFSSMPFENIKINCAIEETLSSDFVKKIKLINNRIIEIIEKTNNIIKSLEKDVFRKYNGVIFFGLPKKTLSFPEKRNDFTAKWYERFFYHNQKKNPNSSFYEFPSHCVFDEKNRRWKDTGSIFFLKQLIELLKEKKAGKIVYENFYILNHFLSTQKIYLPAVLDYIGVEAIGVDYDPYEYGFMVLQRQMFQSRQFHRFTPYPHMEEIWDKKYGLENVKYTTLTDHFEIKEKEKELKEDYSILILSNSRLNAVKSHFAAILFLVSNFDENSIYKDFQIWGWAMRYIIQNQLSVSDMEKLHFSGKVFQLFYNVGQFLKYEVIESLDTERKIQIFGDNGWDVVFPEYYQNKFLSQNEIAEMHLDKKHLLLGFNHSVDYLQTSGPIIDSIPKNIPFINFPTLAKNENFEAFKIIEYANNDELNKCVNNACEIYQDEYLNQSIDYYKSLLAQSEKEVSGYIFSDTPFPEDGGSYYKECCSHKKILQQEIDSYIKDHNKLLQDSIDIFLANKQYNIDINQTRFYNRKYLKRIVNSMRLR